MSDEERQRWQRLGCVNGVMYAASLVDFAETDVLLGRGESEIVARRRQALIDMGAEPSDVERLIAFGRRLARERVATDAADARDAAEVSP